MAESIAALPASTLVPWVCNAGLGCLRKERMNPSPSPSCSTFTAKRPWIPLLLSPRTEWSWEEADAKCCEQRGWGKGMRWRQWDPGHWGDGITYPGHWGDGITNPGHRGAGITDPRHRGAGITNPGHWGAGITDPGHRGTGITNPGHGGAGITLESQTRGSGGMESQTPGTGEPESRWNQAAQPASSLCHSRNPCPRQPGWPRRDQPFLANVICTCH